MSQRWLDRKARLSSLLKSHGDEDEDGLALDRVLHGKSVIGTTAKTAEIDSLRFTDKDLSLLGTLSYGQFGLIELVTCHIDRRVYVRKSIEKQFALKTRDQCSPKLERDILLRATKTNSPWAPHILCAFHTTTHVKMLMDFAEGGTLWDALESSPLDGRISEDNLKWWAPQAISAIHWCHSQGFAHRDIKPHNFVITSSAHLLLIDFGSAAPLLPPRADGTQLIPKQHCLVPCGTCDYISPEILQAHEDALLALEMAEDAPLPSISYSADVGGYGVETDWWSMGAMLYEMVYGVAPFFAEDIRTTYLRIINHEKSLRFNKAIPVSAECQDFLRGLLTRPECRLGRHNAMEVTEHPFFELTNWATLQSAPAPPDLHLPQFTYNHIPAHPSLPTATDVSDTSRSQPFAFSALFQSSTDSSPGLSILRSKSYGLSSSSASPQTASFIGFSWGPAKDAFQISATNVHIRDLASGEPFQPYRTIPIPSNGSSLAIPPAKHATSTVFATPIRPSTLTPLRTLPRSSTVRRTAQGRELSDREAMKQLVDCIGMSARKKVMESGRKPRILRSLSRRGSVSFGNEMRLRPVQFSADGSGSGYSDESAPAMVLASEGTDDTESEGPPSPSPSPRPGSALSMMSKRSTTPTISASYSYRLLHVPLAISYGPGRHGKNESEVSMTGEESTDVFERLERRHTLIMQDIDDIGNRLSLLYAWLKNGEG